VRKNRCTIVEGDSARVLLESMPDSLIDDSDATISATGTNTDGKITDANKTISYLLVRRKRTKNITMFRPLKLDEDQVAADTASTGVRRT
jgi:hypothetical protein